MRAVVGYRGGDDTPEALALAAVLRRTTGAELSVVAVLPHASDHPGIANVDLEYRVWLDSVAADARTRAAAALSPDHPDALDFHRVAETSVAAGLLDVAEQLEADVLVVGSARSATHGSIMVGSVTDRLLHSSHVPILLAPQGYADSGSRCTTLTCAYVGTPRSQEALGVACKLARRYGLTLRVVTFVPRAATMFPPEVGFDAEDLVSAQWAEQAAALHDEALELCRKAGVETATAEIARGQGWAGALAGLTWAPDEVLVLGSSRLGHLARVFLGSTATKIIRCSPVPVLVVPSGTAHLAGND